MSDRIDTIEKLYTRLIDSRDGYGTLAENADRGTLAAIAGRVLETRARFAERLAAELKAGGRDPGDDGSRLAAAHRVFMNLRDRLSDGDEAVADEALRGEEMLLSTYDDAIEATANDPRWAFLAEQRATVAASAEEIRAVAKTSA